MTRNSNTIDAAYAQAVINEVTRQREAALDQIVGLRLEMQARDAEIEQIKADLQKEKARTSQLRKRLKTAKG